MATATGTANSAVDLLNKLNTFLIGTPGWTKLRGETDIAPASPKSARYWRVLWLENDDVNADFREIELMEWRTTSGGANVATTGTSYAFKSIASGTGADLVSGTTPIISPDIDDDIWWVSYDFGVGTIIREITIMADTDNYAPSNIIIQWSNDNFSWTDMARFAHDTSRYTADNQTFTYTWDTGAGYTHPDHYSATIARRRGTSFSDLISGSTGPGQQENWNDDIWSWQGPGYDAARRVYVAAVPSFDLATSDEYISFSGSIAVDTGFDANDWWFNQSGVLGKDVDSSCPTLNISSNGVTYWFYGDGNRFIIVIKNGVDDYTMAYCGFMSAFAQPDDYPFPLYIGGSSANIFTSLSQTGTYVRDAGDPAYSAAWYRRWDNSWIRASNHRDHASFNRYWDPNNFNAHIWPKHIGVTGRSDYPFSVMSDYFDGTTHYMDNMDPTDQDDLPIIPQIVMDPDFGFVGALTGLFAVPGGSLLAPEATFTIGADTYRIFTTRDHSEGGHYYCVKEV